MILSNGQKWFLVIVLSIPLAILLIAVAIGAFPRSSRTSTPEEDRASRYHQCMSQAMNFFGTNKTGAIKQCKDIFGSTEN